MNKIITVLSIRARWFISDASRGPPGFARSLNCKTQTSQGHVWLHVQTDRYQLIHFYPAGSNKVPGREMGRNSFCQKIGVQQGAAWFQGPKREHSSIRVCFCFCMFPRPSWQTLGILYFGFVCRIPQISILAQSAPYESYGHENTGALHGIAIRIWWD